ncbi:MAG: hypothetical protein PHV60_01885 [bacterium]|nr:hypothetical protein [bacterium]
MKKAIVSFLWLAAFTTLLPAMVYGRLGISTTLTAGPDKYLANFTSLRISLSPKLDLEGTYSHIDSDLTSQPLQMFTGGVSVILTDDLSLRGNYSFTSPAAGYEANGYALGTTVSLSGDSNFQTAIDLDYGIENNVYNVHTDSFTAYYRNGRGRYRQIIVSAKDTTETIKQVVWTMGITETFYEDTSLYLGYSNYRYDPDIEGDVVLYDASARQNNFQIFSLTPGLAGFPKYSYEIRISRNFLSLWTVNTGYLHAGILQFTLNENDTPANGTVGNLLDDFYEVAGVSADSYSLGLEYCLNSWIALNTGYNLYREAYQDINSYYSLGITLTF